MQDSCNSDLFPIYEALEGLGFVKEGWGLKYKHSQFELSAVKGGFPPGVVSFAGRYESARSMGLIDFKLPENLDSLEQLKALLAYYLNRQVTIDRPEWLDEGVALSKHLPF